MAKKKPSAPAPKKKPATVQKSSIHQPAIGGRPTVIRILTFGVPPNGPDGPAQDNFALPVPFRVGGRCSTQEVVQGRIIRMDTGVDFDADATSTGFNWMLVFSNVAIPRGIPLLLHVWVPPSVSGELAAEDSRGVSCM